MSAVASCWHRHLGHQRAGGLCVIARQQPVTTASQNKLHMWQLIDTPIDCPGTHLTCVGCTAPPAPLRTRHTGSSGGSARQVPQTGHCWTCHLLSPSQKLLVTNDCCRASTYTLRSKMVCTRTYSAITVRHNSAVVLERESSDKRCRRAKKMQQQTTVIDGGE